jgi:predicted nucleic acid-binding protein
VVTAWSLAHRRPEHERFADAVALLMALPIERHPAVALLPRAYELRANVTAYDAMYIALTE